MTVRELRRSGFSAAEVTNTVPRAHTSATASITASRDVFFNFMIDLILSSMLFLLKALAKGPRPLFCSSRSIRVMA